MRIACFSRATPVHDPSGGLERHTATLVEGLAVRGHAVQVITSARPAGAAAGEGDEHSGPLRWTYLAGTRPGSYRGGYWRRAAACFAAEHQRAPFDLIISQSAGAFGVLTQKRRPPVLLILHGTTLAQLGVMLRSRLRMSTLPRAGLLYAWHLGFNRRLIPRAERVVAVSAELARRAQREFSLPPERLEVIANGIDTERFAPGGGSGPGGAEILYAGRIRREKGLPLLFAAVARLRREFPSLRLTCYGDGQDRQAFREELAASGLDAWVTLPGTLTQAELAARLAGADLFVLPSREHEGQPLILLEAMACGVPVVATTVGGVPDLVGSEGAGRLVPPGDLAALREAMAALLHDPVARRRMGRLGRARVEEHFSRQAMLDRYEALAHRLVAGEAA